MRVTLAQKLMSLCGIMLAVLLVSNTAPPLIAEGIDLAGMSTLAGGWVPVSSGTPCQGNTTLYCSGGDPGYGVDLCTGGTFSGVTDGPPYNGYVYLITPASCGTGLYGNSTNCPYMWHSDCRP